MTNFHSWLKNKTQNETWQSDQDQLSGMGRR